MPLMVPWRIQILTLLLSLAPLAAVAGGDARRIPAVHRPDRFWLHRGEITLGGPPCKRSAEEYRRASRAEPANAAVARCHALLAGRESGMKRHPSSVVAAHRWTELDPDNFDALIF